MTRNVRFMPYYLIATLARKARPAGGGAWIGNA
jgi:hypothetical protein